MNYLHFADPTGRSALRAASHSNPRNRPCPTCGQPNRLTPEDEQLGYQCDSCAEAVEGPRHYDDERFTTAYGSEFADEFDDYDEADACERADYEEDIDAGDDDVRCW